MPLRFRLILHDGSDELHTSAQLNPHLAIYASAIRKGLTSISTDEIVPEKDADETEEVNDVALVLLSVEPFLLDTIGVETSLEPAEEVDESEKDDILHNLSNMFRGNVI